MNIRVIAGWAGLALMTWMPVAAADDAAGIAGAMVGSEFAYAVQPGDSLTLIGARFGMAPSVLARVNGLRFDAWVYPGQVLQIDNRHIVAATLADGMLINIPQRMLFYFQAGELLAYYPVGLGRPDWPTPEGRFRVIDLQENKIWHVPLSIQEEMRRESEAVLTEVPPGPDNPLGKYWIGISLPGIGIHGTIAPASIYHFQSHGCIRLHPDDIAALFLHISRDETGLIVYAPVLLARLDDGRIFLEANPDAYGRGVDPLSFVADMAQRHDWQDVLDWNKVQTVIRQQDGLAHEVGLPAATGKNVH
jgi:L,D-transpeptidase ErfK/SrfK